MRAALEIAVGYGLILATIWSVPPARAYFGCVLLFWVIKVLLPEAREGGSFGLGLSGIRESLWAVGLALSAFAITILCASALGTFHYHPVAKPYPPFSGYLAFSLAQQFVLQNLFFLKLLRLCRPGLAMGLAALMMSMAHLPNILLVIVTLLWGMAACWLFFRYRNLYVVGSIHFLLGVMLALCVPSSVQHNMRVGSGYSAYRVSHRPRQDTRGLATFPLPQHSVRPTAPGAGTGQE